MPRAILNLQDPADLRAVQGQWRFAPGFIPGEPNEGLISQAEGSPARLPEYDDSGWEVRHDITTWHSRGFTIALLAVNGPFGQPGGAVFVRYAFLAFEWRTPGY